MNNIFMGGFQDIAAGFYITASEVPTGQANMILAKWQSFVNMVITVAGVFFLYLIPALFIVKGMIATIPGASGLVSKLPGVDMGSGGDGILGYLKSNAKEFIVAIIFTLNAASGLWATEMGWFSEGMAVVVQKIANANWSTADTPGSIAQFKQEVKVYSDKQCSQMYESYLKKEATMAQALTNYIQTQHPDNNDMNFVRQKASYTGVVCRLQILSDKLQKDNYAEAAGISDANFYKRHLQSDKATSDQSGAFNPNFIQSSMVKAFGTTLPSGSN